MPGSFVHSEDVTGELGVPNLLIFYPIPGHLANEHGATRGHPRSSWLLPPRLSLSFGMWAYRSIGEVRLVNQQMDRPPPHGRLWVRWILKQEMISQPKSLSLYRPSFSVSEPVN